ncbi:hypothetical protein F0562_003330 [Nyssa sinensis]|uniref:CCHC-type domain-containing protein n=1 Tax=Nyssa sinensis TaxID=561372 RepID=A0A5J5C0A6_9ASTE|nr:hypothetical protein F0562_003330 [Nyssa sinensis]
MELEDIFGHLLNFELRLQQHTQVVEATIGSGNVATRTDYSRGPHGKTQYSNCASSYSGSLGRGRGRGSRHGSLGGNRPMCQICDKVGHLAIKCFHRFDQAYKTMPNNMFAFFTTQQAPANTNCSAAAVVPHSSPHVTASHTEPTTTSASSLSFSPAASTASPPLFSSSPSPTISPVPAPSDAALPSEPLPSRSHPMTTRSQNNIVKPKQFFDGTTRAFLQCLGFETNSDASSNQRDLKTNEINLQDPPTCSEREIKANEDVLAKNTDVAVAAMPPRPPINSGGGGQTN